MKTIVCPNCESENDGGSIVCQVCGEPISEALITEPIADSNQDSGTVDSVSEEVASPDTSGVEQPQTPEKESEATEIAKKKQINADDLDEWLRELPPLATGEQRLKGRPRDTDGALPTWLQEVRATADEQSPASEPGLVDWLSGLEGDESSTPAVEQSEDELPDWVSALTKSEKWPEADDPEALADWFASSEEVGDHLLPQTNELPMTAPLDSSRELDGIPEQLVGDSLPEWLMREAGAEEAVESADYRPSDRKPYMGQASEESWAEADLSANQAIPKQAETVEQPPLADETSAGAEEKLEWLEELEDQEVEAAIDEILLSDLPEVEKQELEIAPEDEPQAVDEAARDHDIEKVVAATLLLDELTDEDREADPIIDEPVLMDDAGAEDQRDETNLAEMLAVEAAIEELSATESDDWLGYLEESPEASKADNEGEPTLRSDIELEQADIPEWLRAMKPDESGPSDGKIAEEVKEEKGPLAGLRGVVPLAAAATGSGQISEPARFEITKEQQQQIALLEQLTLASPDRPSVGSVSGDKERWKTERLVLGLLLLLVVLFAYFVPVDRWLPFLSEWPVTEATDSAYQMIDQVGGNNVLLAFEYTPAMAGELDVIADSVLAELAGNSGSLLTVSQAAAGVVMAQEALDRSDIEQVYDLGFLPGDAVGLRGLGNCLSLGSDCSSMIGLPLEDEAAVLLSDVSLIVIFTGDRDSLVNWVEQVEIQTEAPVIAGLTQSLGPVAAPYLASKQLAAIIEGAPAAAAYEYSQDGAASDNIQLLRSFTLAQWLVIVVMVAGGFYFGVIRRPTETAEKMGVR